jgi:hypothetical protein
MRAAIAHGMDRDHRGTARPFSGVNRPMIRQTELIAWVLLALATVVITGLFARALLGILRGELRTLSA